MKLFAGILTLLCLSMTAQAQHSSHDHHIAVFAGATAAHSKTYTTFGVDYEYLLTPVWGIGALAESIATDPNTTVVAALLYVHPIENLKFFLGGGNESVSGHTTSLTRIGAAYDFHVGDYSISPTVANDHFQGGASAVVYGLSFGIGF